MAGRRREIGATTIWLSGGGKEHSQRPAAGLAHLGQRRLVDAVYVRPFLAVDLDVYEVLVHHGRGFRIFEAFLCHHVTPVAGGIADGEQDWLVFAPCFIEGIFVPRLPRHGIPSVRQQVGAGFLVEAVIEHQSSSFHYDDEARNLAYVAGERLNLYTHSRSSR